MKSFNGDALNRLEREEIQKILIQNSIFSGFTRAINTADVFDEAGK
ncbi:hypothetical protein AB4259_15175 [Vibrio amylolyticus]